jgi:four helix bundle protein
METLGLENFIAWQKAVSMAAKIIRLTQSGELSRHHWICDQLRRAALSVPSNIAEGYERRAKKDTPRFYQIAMGSCAEVKTQLRVGVAAHLIRSEEGKELEVDCTEVLKILTGVLKARANLTSTSRQPYASPFRPVDNGKQ